MHIQYGSLEVFDSCGDVTSHLLAKTMVLRIVTEFHYEKLYYGGLTGDVRMFCVNHFDSYFPIIVDVVVKRGVRCAARAVGISAQ